jgi:excisionase family DNA binding protein
MTVKEAAEALAVKPSTVRAWIHRSEKLEVVKVGGPSGYLESLASFIRANTMMPISAEPEARSRYTYTKTDPD